MFKTLLAAASILPLLAARAAGVFPVAPNTFSANASYDANFKESAINTGNTRNPGGYIQLQGFRFCASVFDTSATGGSNGSGGTGGNDADNHFSDLTISAEVASTEVGQFGLGFLLRLDNAEANGYFAAFVPASQNSVTFNLYEGAGLIEGNGTNIFAQTVPVAGAGFNINTFYLFKVTASGSTFSFDFGSGAATASFTDSSPSATTGQLGFALLAATPTSATRMDNFTIVPEPTTGSFVVVTLATLFAAGLRRQSPRRFWTPVS